MKQINYRAWITNLRQRCSYTEDLPAIIPNCHGRSPFSGRSYLAKLFLSKTLRLWKRVP